MRNFSFYHRVQKLTIVDSAKQIYTNLVPFWIKSRLPIRQKQHVIRMIKNLYEQHVKLMKNFRRSTDKDKQNQKEYTDKLEKMFDISHANSDKIIRNEEDKQFLMLQRSSRTGVIGPADKKLAIREKKSALRIVREKLFEQRIAKHKINRCKNIGEFEEDEAEEDNEYEDFIGEGEDVVIIDARKKGKEQKQIMSNSVAAVLDRTGTSIRKSTMITASVK